jgi:putative ABC transport system permease protein
MNDLKFALRQLLKNPGFTAVAVLTLALGIGANTAVFSLVNAALLRPLPSAEPDRLVFLSERSRHLDNMSIAYLNFKDWQQQNQVFTGLSAFRNASYNLTGGEQLERIDALQVSASFFPTLGVAPMLGRVFRDDEDAPGSARTVVLSEGLWRRRFGGQTNILDRILQLDGEAHTVIGIMPAYFQFPRTTELWTALGLNADTWQNRGNHLCTHIFPTFLRRGNQGIDQREKHSQIRIRSQRF